MSDSYDPKPVSNYWIQSAAAYHSLWEMHLQLLAEGFEWDGMDGYTAPDGYDWKKFRQTMMDMPDWVDPEKS